MTGAAPALEAPRGVRSRREGLRSGLLDAVQRVFGGTQDLVGIGAVPLGLGDADADRNRYRLLGGAGARRLSWAPGLGYRDFHGCRFDGAPDRVEMLGSGRLRHAPEDHGECLLSKVEHPASSSDFRERGGDQPQHAAGRIGPMGLTEARKVVDFYPRERVVPA